MNAAFTILTVLVIIASILLILVVLLQNGKGEGLASNFVAGNQAFGVRQTADLLEKITWGLVAFILVVSVIASFTTQSKSTMGVDITDKLEQTQTTEQPAFPIAPMASEAPATEEAAAETPTE
ncbi:MAG: preprotein translocase subunit SecG [Bacteroidales bacterium]|nr:preprotein translocase subunit SecG [Bacteroidales bacterium]